MYLTRDLDHSRMLVIPTSYHRSDQIGTGSEHYLLEAHRDKLGREVLFVVF